MLLSDLNDTAMVAPFNSPVWSVQKLDISWGVTIAYCKFNQMIAPTVTAVLDVVSLLEQINTILFAWYVNIELVRIFFLIIIKRKNQSWFVFS